MLYVHDREKKTLIQNGLQVITARSGDFDSLKLVQVIAILRQSGALTTLRVDSDIYPTLFECDAYRY